MLLGKDTISAILSITPEIDTFILANNVHYLNIIYTQFLDVFNSQKNEFYSSVHLETF